MTASRFSSAYGRGRSEGTGWYSFNKNGSIYWTGECGDLEAAVLVTRRRAARMAESDVKGLGTSTPICRLRAHPARAVLSRMGLGNER